jgi:hypothetical protein
MLALACRRVLVLISRQRVNRVLAIHLLQDRKERMCYHLDMTTPFQPMREPSNPLDWLQQEQNRLTQKLGEPILIRIRLIYDGFYEVKISTFTDRYGLGKGWSLPEALAAAVDCLLALDKFHPFIHRLWEEDATEIGKADEETEEDLIF